MSNFLPRAAGIHAAKASLRTGALAIVAVLAVIPAGCNPVESRLPPSAEVVTSPQKQLFTNRLIQSKSPYLLQHAHNPVDWYPWGEEAFAKARKENKPIFLSVGYSTCHWCHVMEHESFENPQIA